MRPRPVPLLGGILAAAIALSLTSAWAQSPAITAVASEGDVLSDGTTVQTITSRCGASAPWRPCVATDTEGQASFFGTTGDGVQALFGPDGVLVTSGEPLPDRVTATLDPAFTGGLASGKRSLAFLGLDDAVNAVFTPAGLVVEQGDTLPDDTTASIILLGGVATNARAQVAFHGRDVVFTEDGQIAAGKQELADGTTIGAVSYFGGIAGSGTSGRFAFQGFVDNEQAIFTQDGLIARVGPLPDGSHLQSIDLFAGVAINPSDVVAFLGRTDGYDAVFTQEGLLARAGEPLGDGAELEAIRTEGGVAINRSGTVVFHCEAPGGRHAVCSQEGVIAAVGDRVRGGSRLEEIHAEGGLALNSRGYVAFHGVTDGRAAVLVAR